MESLLVTAGKAVAAARQPTPDDAAASVGATGTPAHGHGATGAGLPPLPAVRGRLPRRGIRSTFMEAMILDHCLDEETKDDSDAGDGAEEAEEEDPSDGDSVEAGGDDEQGLVPGTAAGGRAQPPPQATNGPGPALRDGLASGQVPPTELEPTFSFQPLPSLAQLKDNTDEFTSQFMELIVRSWPQAEVTRTSRKANAAGARCGGARPRAAKGTDADLKTWASRIHTALLFANFVGRAICIPTTGPRPCDAEIDRGVAKFFSCLNESTLEVINRFLDSRRRGYAVAGGGAPVQEKTIKAYSAGLTHLFARARVSGVAGKRVVPDCIGVSAPWQLKGVAELEREQRGVRADAGLFVGNPMMADDVRLHKTSAEREARQAGEHSTTSGNVTPALLLQLFDALVTCHLPARKMAGDMPAGISSRDAPAPAVSEPPNNQAPVPPPGATEPAAPPAGQCASQSASETDFLAYLFYAFLFVTLARPISLLNLKYKDISLPDPLVAGNEQFFNQYVAWDCLLVCVCSRGCRSRFVFLAMFIMTCF